MLFLSKSGEPSHPPRCGLHTSGLQERTEDFPLASVKEQLPSSRSEIPIWEFFRSLPSRVLSCGPSLGLGAC